MKKNIITISSLIALLGLLVGCSTGGNPSSDKGKTVHIDFWHTFNKDTKAEVERRIQDFQELILENEGVTVEVMSDNYGDYTGLYDNIVSGYSIGQVPNIAVAYPDHVASFLQMESKDGDLVYNLDPMMANEQYGFGKQAYLGDTDPRTGDPYLKDDLVSAFMKEAASFSKEGTYVLPMMKSSEVMFYNEKLLTTALKAYDSDKYSSTQDAIDFIENVSWEEFMKFCRFVVDNDKPNVKDLDFNLNWPMYYDSDGNMFISKMFQENIPFTSIKDGAGHLDFAEPENRLKTIELATELKADFDYGVFSTKGIKDEYGSTYFTKGETMFTIGSSGGATFSFPQGDAFTTGVCKAPASNDNPLYVTQGPCITLLKSVKDGNNKPKSAEQIALEQEYAWKLVKYLTNPQLNAELCIFGSHGYIPVRTSAYTTGVYVDYLGKGVGVSKVAEVVQSMSDEYFYTAAFKGSAELRECCKGLMTSLFTGTEPESAVDEMIRKAKASL